MKCDALIDDRQSLFDLLSNVRALEVGYKAVAKNWGSPGIDGQTTQAFGANLKEELRQLSKELQSWTYKPKPVKRVEIPKEGKNKGVRLLGIPCVRDRVVQATMKQLLEPILEPIFSESSYGFRPNRNQGQALRAAQSYNQAGKEYVVDIDLSKFFDRINQDKLINRLSKQIPDKRILRLIGITLRSGVLIEGLVQATPEGAMQGSPLSPLLSNVVLDELDKELERRGLSFCRYADGTPVQA